MATESVDIAREPADVFAYATDFAQFPRWQGNALSVHQDGQTQTPARAGTQAVVTRRIGPRRVRATEKIIELTPPRAWVVRSDGGLPVTAIATGAIQPLDDGCRSRVTITLEFEGHGIGKLLIPLIIARQARKQLPQNAARLKQALELR